MVQVAKFKTLEFVSEIILNEVKTQRRSHANPPSGTGLRFPTPSGSHLCEFLVWVGDEL